MGKGRWVAGLLAMVLSACVDSHTRPPVVPPSGSAPPPVVTPPTSEPPPSGPPPVDAAQRVHMRAWVRSGGDGARRVRVQLWRDEPLEVELQAAAIGMSQGPASLEGQPTGPIMVGPEPVTLEFTWNVGRDCSGDLLRLRLSAHAHSREYGDTRATAWLRECAATGQTELHHTGEWPAAVRAVDMDGDGRKELIVAHELSPSLLVLFPEGDGYRRRYVYVGRSSDWMWVRDLNADGRVDVVLAEEGSDELIVMLGEGQRLFGPPRAYELGAPVSGVDFADVDGDGQLDVLGMDGALGRYHLLRGRPDGSFQAWKSGIAPDGARQLLAVELTGDGRIDLAFPPSELVAVGDGAGRFSPRSLPTRTTGFQLQAADLDGDGINELLGLERLEQEGQTRVHAFGPDTGDTFSTRLVTTVAAHVYGDGVRIADLDGDGRRDFVFLNSTSDSSGVCIQENDRPCMLRETNHGYCHQARDAELADLDGDAVTELVVPVSPGCYQPGFVSVTRATREGMETSTLHVENPISQTVLVDANGDGRKELAVGAHDVTLLGLDGTWTTESHLDVGGQVRALAAGDFTGDGRTDLAALNEHRQVFILEGRATGAFERAPLPLATLPPPGREQRWYARMVSGDFNRDGREDLLLTSRELGTTLLSSSGAGYQASNPFSPSTSSAVVADLDHDSWPDVLLSGDFGTASLLSRADGTFVSAWEERLFAGRSALLHDLTGTAWRTSCSRRRSTWDSRGAAFFGTGSWPCRRTATCAWWRPATGTRTAGRISSGRAGTASAWAASRSWWSRARWTSAHRFRV